MRNRNLRGVSVFAGALALSLMLALSAGAADCQNVDLISGATSGNDQTVRTGIVGAFLWVQTGEYAGGDELDGTISHEIPAGAITASACPDGSVSFDVPDPAPVEVVVDVEPVEQLTPDEEAERFIADYGLSFPVA